MSIYSFFPTISSSINFSISFHIVLSIHKITQKKIKSKGFMRNWFSLFLFQPSSSSMIWLKWKCHRFLSLHDLSKTFCLTLLGFPQFSFPSLSWYVDRNDQMISFIICCSNSTTRMMMMNFAISTINFTSRWEHIKILLSMVMWCWMFGSERCNYKGNQLW